MVKATDAAAPAYAMIAADFAGSCRRSADWEMAIPAPPAEAQPTPTAKGGPSLKHAAALPPLSSTVAPAASPARSSSTDAKSVSLRPQGSDESCAAAVLAADQWQKMNLIVINYVDALGRLAGTQQSSGQVYGFDTLAKSLTASDVLSQTQATAIQTLFGTVVTQIFNSQRADAIAKSAPQAKEALNDLLDRLEYVADVDYRGLLSRESSDINEFYVHSVQLSDHQGFSLQSIPYRQQWISDREALNKRVAAIDAYRASLEALRSAHNILVDQTTHPDPNIESVVAGYISQFLPQIEAVKSAFQARSSAGAATQKNGG